MSKFSYIVLGVVAVLAVSLFAMREAPRETTARFQDPVLPSSGAVTRGEAGSVAPQATQAQEQAVVREPETRPADPPSASATTAMEYSEELPELPEPTFEDVADLEAAEAALEVRIVDELFEAGLSTEEIEEVLTAVLPDSAQQGDLGHEPDLSDEELEAAVAADLTDAGAPPEEIEAVLEAILPYGDDEEESGHESLASDLASAGTPSDEIDEILSAVHPELSGD